MAILKDNKIEKGFYEFLKEKGIEVQIERDVQIDLSISSYIPESFIEDSSQKIEIYQNIALCRTEEDIQNAKKGIIAAIKTIDDEQDTGITYYFGQELSGSEVSIEEYQNKIEKVTKEDVIYIAENVAIHTIYFLKD